MRRLHCVVPLVAESAVYVQRIGRLLLPGALVMSILAAGPCVTSKSSSAAKTAKGVADAQADSADQVLYGVHATLTDQGVKKGLVVADRGYVFEDGTRIEMRGITVTFLDTLGIETAHMTAATGTYRLAQAHVDARGKVVVATPGGRKLESETLRFDLVRNVVSGNGAYTLSDSVPKRRSTGTAFEFEPRLVKVVAPVAPKAAAPKTRGGAAGRDTSNPKKSKPTGTIGRVP
jgi:hypothetical protein